MHGEKSFKTMAAHIKRGVDSKSRQYNVGGGRLYNVLAIFLIFTTISSKFVLTFRFYVV